MIEKIITNEPLIRKYTLVALKHLLKKDEYKLIAGKEILLKNAEYMNVYELMGFYDMLLHKDKIALYDRDKFKKHLISITKDTIKKINDGNTLIFTLTLNREEGNEFYYTIDLEEKSVYSRSRDKIVSLTELIIEKDSHELKSFVECAMINYYRGARLAIFDLPFAEEDSKIEEEEQIDFDSSDVRDILEKVFQMDQEFSKHSKKRKEGKTEHRLKKDTARTRLVFTLYRGK